MKEETKLLVLSKVNALKMGIDKQIQEKNLVSCCGVEGIHL